MIQELFRRFAITPPHVVFVVDSAGAVVDKKIVAMEKHGMYN